MTTHLFTHTHKALTGRLYAREALFTNTPKALWPIAPKAPG
jgi:hypothetical protein